MFFKSIEKIYNIYKIDNLKEEAESWLNFRQNQNCQNISFIDFLNNNCTFFPSISAVFEIFVSLLATSFMAVRVFSTLSPLRRVET